MPDERWAPPPRETARPPPDRLLPLEAPLLPDAAPPPDAVPPVDTLLPPGAAPPPPDTALPPRGPPPRGIADTPPLRVLGAPDPPESAVAAGGVLLPEPVLAPGGRR